MKSNSSSLFGYVANLLKAYAELQKQFNHTLYRIIDIKEDNVNNTSLVVQVTGKATVFEISAKEIAADNNMLEGFSKRDVRTITYLASKETNLLSQYEVIEQNICTESNEVLFSLKQKFNPEIITKSAKQISLDKKLVNSLKPEVALNIGFIVGTESVINEKDEIRKISSYNTGF